MTKQLNTEANKHWAINNATQIWPKQILIRVNYSPFSWELSGQEGRIDQIYQSIFFSLVTKDVGYCNVTWVY